MIFAVLKITLNHNYYTKLIWDFLHFYFLIYHQLLSFLCAVAVYILLEVYSSLINPNKQAGVVSPEAELVHGHRQVSRLTETLVGVAVIHGDQVHITEDKALVVVLFQSFHVAHVQQLGPVKDLISFLIQEKLKTDLSSI